MILKPELVPGKLYMINDMFFYLHNEEDVYGVFLKSERVKLKKGIRGWWYYFLIGKNIKKFSYNTHNFVEIT